MVDVFNTMDTPPYGEFHEANVAAGAAVALTSAVVANVTSIALPAGDWMVEGTVYFHCNGSALVDHTVAGTSAVSATIGGSGSYSSDYLQITPSATTDATYIAPQTRYTSSVPFTVYLIAESTHSGVGGTCAAYGHISARKADGNYNAMIANSVYGTKTNDSAAAGMVGEYIEVDNIAAQVAIVSGVIKAIQSMTLSPGDWDVRANISFVAAATTSVTWLSGGTNTIQNVFGPTSSTSQSIFSPVVPGGAVGLTLIAPEERYSFSVPTTIYLNVHSVFTIAGMTCGAAMSARRVR